MKVSEMRGVSLVVCLVLALALVGCDKEDKKLARQLGQAAKELAKEVERATAQKQQGEVKTEPLVKGKKEVGHRDFDAAKQVLPLVYKGLEEDIYCGCRYSGKTMNLKSCGYVPRKNAQRASRLEWEHVVPAEHFGSQRQCWQKGGRKNCSGHDPLFDMMEGDLNNLMPSVGEVNGDRSNMSYGVWARNPEPVYGQCMSVPDFKTRRFQPREEARGRLGRASLYMHTRYALSMSDQDRKLWCAWAKTYPVDAWERARDKQIQRFQGEGNLLLEDAAQLAKVCKGA